MKKFGWLNLLLGGCGSILFLAATLSAAVACCDKPTLKNVSSQTAVAEMKTEHKSFPRLAGDYEPQRALVLSVSDLQPHHSNVLKQLVEKTSGHTPVLILCNNRDQLVLTLSWLKDIADKCDHVQFGELKLDTIWLRDFAPFHAQTETGSQSIDFYYVGERPLDDKLPKTWSERTGSTLVEVPWTLQGGNLLCNGQHVAVTTERIFQDNAITFPNPLPSTDVRSEARKLVIDAVTEGCNLEQLVILDHLQSEETKHADMFATFVAADQIVVASVDPRFDPINAAILDRNARQLQSVRVGGRPLQVTRIPIPPRNGKSWSAYTNVIIANDLLLMPVYETDPPAMVAAAVAVYQQLLPHHTIKTVDITTFKQLQGELHCLSMNLPKFAPMPRQTVGYRRVVELLGAEKSSSTK